jgi:putative Holliday junction resolvase
MSVPGRIIALDVGDARTGVATTDPLQIIASPHSVVEESSRKEAIAAIVGIVAELEPVCVVVGLPLETQGTRGAQAKKVMVFAALLREAIDVEIVFHDERYTTVAAEEMLVAADVSRKKRKKVIDKIAATNILQSYLDELSDAGTPPGGDAQR